MALFIDRMTSSRVSPDVCVLRWNIWTTATEAIPYARRASRHTRDDQRTA